MQLRRAAAVTLASAFAAVGLLAQPATAGNSDNSGAWVTGGTIHNYCAVGDFCLYTGMFYSGRVYGLPNCTDYALHEWNGVGSWKNNQTPADYNTDAEFKDANRKVIGHGWLEWGAEPGVNFNPVYYVRPCG